MKHKIKTSIAFIVLSMMLGFIIPGCKSQTKIQVIDSTNVVTNTVPVKTFNDEHYVWENFYFSTNKVQNAK